MIPLTKLLLLALAYWGAFLYALSENASIALGVALIGATSQIATALIVSRNRAEIVEIKRSVQQRRKEVREEADRVVVVEEKEP